MVAGGVETAAQRDLLRCAGYDYGKGFLFAPPTLPESVRRLDRRRRERKVRSRSRRAGYQDRRFHEVLTLIVDQGNPISAALDAIGRDA